MLVNNLAFTVTAVEWKTQGDRWRAYNWKEFFVMLCGLDWVLFYKICEKKFTGISKFAGEPFCELMNLEARSIKKYMNILLKMSTVKSGV